MNQPIVLKDPKVNTIVYLKPSQPLELVFTPQYGQVEIVGESDFLDCVETVSEDSTFIYTYKNIPDITPWSNLSQTFLGEIKVMNNGVCCIIGIVLDSLNKSIMTVINPEGWEIKLRPNQFLEIILLNCSDHPKPTITAGSCGLRYSHVSWPMHLYAQQYSHAVFARKLPAPSKTCLFELSNEIDTWASGCYNAGNIILSNNGEKYGVFINLRLKRKDKHSRYYEKDCWKGYYQEINLKPKPFTVLEEDCKVLEVHDGTRIRKV